MLHRLARCGGGGGARGTACLTLERAVPSPMFAAAPRPPAGCALPHLEVVWVEPHDVRPHILQAGTQTRGRRAQGQVGHNGPPRARPMVAPTPLACVPGCALPVTLPAPLPAPWPPRLACRALCAVSTAARSSSAIPFSSHICTAKRSSTCATGRAHGRVGAPLPDLRPACRSRASHRTQACPPGRATRGVAPRCGNCQAAPCCRHPWRHGRCIQRRSPHLHLLVVGCVVFGRGHGASNLKRGCSRDAGTSDVP